MRAVKIIFGVLCFGIGVAFCVGAVNSLIHPGFDHSGLDAAIPAMFGAMFLLGSFLFGFGLLVTPGLSKLNGANGTTPLGRYR